MRLESTKLAMWFLPPSVIGYAWICEKHVHVSAVCVMLFLAGFFSMFVPLRHNRTTSLITSWCRSMSPDYQMDICKHSCIHCRCERGPLIDGYGYEQRMPGNSCICGCRSSCSSTGTLGQRCFHLFWLYCLQNAIGDGGLYTIWAGLMFITELLILLVLYKGEKWRESRHGTKMTAKWSGPIFS